MARRTVAADQAVEQETTETAEKQQSTDRDSKTEPRPTPHRGSHSHQHHQWGGPNSGITSEAQVIDRVREMRRLSHDQASESLGQESAKESKERQGEDGKK